MPHYKLRQQQLDLIAILEQRGSDGRPLYSYEYISALFGRSMVAVRKYASSYGIERGHRKMRTFQ